MKIEKNKKIIFVAVLAVLVIGVVIFFVSSGSKKYELAITNIETGGKVSLGENKTHIESVMGEPCEKNDFLNSEMYSYDDNKLCIVYDSNNCAVMISSNSEAYSILNDIRVGDSITGLQKAIGKDLEDMKNKTLYIAGTGGKGKVISEDELEQMIATTGFENIYAISFGTSISEETVEDVTMCTYEVAMGIVK